MSLQSSLPFDGPDGPDGRNKPAALAGLALPVPEGHRDELRLPDGALRETWARFFGLLDDLRPATLNAHAAAVSRQIRDNGVTYNVYADQGGARAWQLEVFPFLISEADWDVIEAGVTQRATLANAIMADIYGPQTLLTRGLLPPGLVYGHPGYLRPLKGYQPPGGSFLQTIAVDLVHTDSGWTVIAHRTETPSGMGYALENRLIISGQYAEAFRDLRVRRLPPAFSQLISTLAHASPESASAPASAEEGASAGTGTGTGRQIVLLSPGPFNETYFEHTFLARYLGITLVEGKDLTVRNDVVYLKTFGGLERVDVILRRLDDVFCDPLELRGDSMIGVPGLLEAMRAGNVTVSNVPGSGFLESPAIHGFLPGISQALLDQPLALPSVMSWWCGEAAAQEEALRLLDEAFVMPTYPRTPGDAPLGMERGLQKLDAWRARLAATPDRYTLQAPLPLSHTPCWEPGDQRGGSSGRIGSRAAMLRVFAVADGNGGWQVMPGGFTRLAPPDLEAVSMQLGGTSADTWVLSSQPAQGLMPMPRVARTGVPSLAGSAVTRPLAVSSRAAENLFWAGRYAERAENVVRVCRQILGSIESNDETDDGTLNMLGQLAQWFGLVTPQTPSPQASLRVFERSLVSALADPDGSMGLMPTLASHARAANEIRNRLSNDHWRTILAARNDFQDAMADAACPAGTAGHGERAYDRSKVLAALEHLAMQLGAISGAQGDRMTRDEAWRLVFIGRHIERLGTLALFLEVAEGSGALESRSGFDLLLHLFDSTLTYRSLFPGRTDVAALVDLLVLEPTNPRGIYGVLDRLREKLAQLPPGGTGQSRVPLAELLPPATALPSRSLLCERERGRHAKLAALCDQLGARMARLSEEIGGRYFSHAGVAPETDLP
ncbi:circularly permuted type 2 ATP-grasp protein [Cupriavidus pauculus]|uniref:circularly permuted type 2 ATP-grasp protein n=1 Tax=Cupriavidus pauculus TaxID=82633 RepID=UPI001EE2A6FC|nr:circularly permuted type 2 ATP-grasp protein [Cupriavidus pauculus]GJG96146.1 circularly permuted type 2 ATP-grasp protein [Cupriavidus pauculus]